MNFEEQPNSADLNERLARSAAAFLLEFFETAVRHRPDNRAALAELAHVYTRIGRVAEGLAIDQKLAALEPDNATVQYNLACSLALTGASQAALDALERAATLGYSDGEFLRSDEDLKSLRGEARFQLLVARLCGKSSS